jgi:hypothetical protein
MTPEVDTRDRVIRLEAEVDALNKIVENMSKKVDEMHTLLTQARGARWLFMILWVGAGALIAKLAWLIPASWGGGHG